MIHDLQKVNLRSKTHRVNAFMGFAGAMMTFVPAVREFIPPEAYGPIIILIGVVYHYLRNVTTQPIDER